MEIMLAQKILVFPKRTIKVGVQMEDEDKQKYFSWPPFAFWAPSGSPIVNRESM